MVLSRLNKDIDYPNIKSVDKEDINYESSLYQISIDDIDIIIALGNVRFSFVGMGILYVPIYLVIDDTIISQIGVFEFLNDNYINLLDDDDDLDIDKLGEPLLYDFSTKTYLLGKEVEETAKELLKEEAKEEEEESDSSTKPIVIEELIETVEDEKNTGIRENWVQTFLENNNYHIMDNEAGGDCLFAVIRDAFAFTGSPYSVEQLRQILSDDVTQNTFDNYKLMYNNIRNAIRQDKIKMFQIRKELKKLKQLYKEHRADKEKGAEYIKKADKLVLEWKKIQSEVKTQKDMLDTEFKMMKGLNTLADFKKFIKTCNFWADAGTISTFERILNIKMIILSSRNYHDDNIKNVLQCGLIVDDLITKDGIFNPRYYIILDYTGNHYKLITYKGRRIFTFKDLPYGLVKLIHDICMKKGGLYSMIPAFKQFGEKNEPLFNEDVVLQFYSRSQHKPPGKGVGEKIDDALTEQFKTLDAIPDWRKILSNFYQADKPIQYDGATWATVEHIYHSQKFKKNNPEFAKQFSLESNSLFSKDPLLAKAAGGKKGIVTEKKTKKKIQLRPKEIRADDEFWTQKLKKMENALRAKFTQIDEARRVLKATGKAKLVHYLGRGRGTETWHHLMKIRKEI